MQSHLSQGHGCEDKRTAGEHGGMAPGTTLPIQGTLRASSAEPAVPGPLRPSAWSSLSLPSPSSPPLPALLGSPHCLLFDLLEQPLMDGLSVETPRQVHGRTLGFGTLSGLRGPSRH